MAAVEAVEDNLSAKAAGNESVDGRMTACDDEIGRRTTTQQPTNERWCGGSAKADVGGSLVAARRWRQRGSETSRRSLAAVRRRRQRQRRWRQATQQPACTIRRRECGAVRGRGEDEKLLHVKQYLCIHTSLDRVLQQGVLGMGFRYIPQL